MHWEVSSIIQAKDDVGSDPGSAGEVLRSGPMHSEGRQGLGGCEDRGWGESKIWGPEQPEGNETETEAGSEWDTFHPSCLQTGVRLWPVTSGRDDGPEQEHGGAPHPSDRPPACSPPRKTCRKSWVTRQGRVSELCASLELRTLFATLQ